MFCFSSSGMNKQHTANTDHQSAWRQLVIVLSGSPGRSAAAVLLAGAGAGSSSGGAAPWCGQFRPTNSSCCRHGRRISATSSARRVPLSPEARPLTHAQSSSATQPRPHPSLAASFPPASCVPEQSVDPLNLRPSAAFQTTRTYGEEGGGALPLAIVSYLPINTNFPG